MTVFNNAWTLLKNREFEMDPRYEDERERRLQGAYDDIDTVKDNRERVLAELHRLSQRRRPEEEAMFNQVMRGGLPNSPRGPDLRHTGGYPGGGLDQSEHELTSLLDPEGRRGQGSPYLSIPEMESETGPMYQERQRQEAEGIEAEGIDLPNGPRVSAVPPADIGRAGSLSPERPPQPWQFEKAWTLLKNRGFEVDPRYEDERERNLQSVDNLEELEMMEALGTPSQYREMVDSRNRQLSQLGPMHRHQQNQEAERIEAEGIQLPDTPSTSTFEDDYPDRSTAPPADIGTAGSSIPPGRGLEPRYLFNPFKYDYNNPTATHQIDPVGQQPPQPKGRSFDDYSDLEESSQARHEFIQQMPEYGALVEMMRQNGQLRQQSEALEQTPLGQALTQARSQPPQPLQFEKAWDFLKYDGMAFGMQRCKECGRVFDIERPFQAPIQPDSDGGYTCNYCLPDEYFQRNSLNEDNWERI